ncbi:MAG TPA: glycosyl transferase [Stellaceae bacterium]|jgi:4-amino-4-deoxy-L-arabinose transferase-like glycosyltransferase|nr:glycosyl transferase [Stellaceae bacterium]
MGESWFAGWRPYLLLGLLCLCLYLPGIAAIPVTDRDEARFAQATRQMLDTHDFLDIRFRDEARNNKPAGIYWLQAAAVDVLSTPQSTAIWPYRVPSLAGASLAVLLTFGFGRALLGEPRRALIGAALLAISLGTVAEAHLAKTDAALLATIAAGQGALGLAYVRARGGAAVGWSTAAAFWLAEIAAIYLKGPIGPGIALITAATLSIADRDMRWLRGLRPVIGIIATVVAVAPWLYAIEHATQGQFLDQSVGHDFLAKITGGQEAHGAPPLYYLGLAFVTFWPGSLFLAPAVIGGWVRRREPAERFLIAWLAPAWIVLELVPTKLPHYALPLYPALALLAAGVMSRGDARRWYGAICTVVWVLVTVSLAVVLGDLGASLSPIAVAAATAVVALAAVLLFRRPAQGITTALLAAMSVAFVMPATSLVLPRLDYWWLSRSAAALVAAHPRACGAGLAVVGYNEPSLVFLLNDGFKSGVADAAVNAGDEALVADRMDAAFQQNLAARGLAARLLGDVHGWDYSNGQDMTLTLYTIAPK